MDRGGHELRELRRADAAVLHFLFDVRLSARRRLLMGRRRQPSARLLARRNLGRTTLAGEGLQHCDGHSHVMASTIPSCRAYDPTFAYELAVIVQDGMRRMLDAQENCFYYVTVMNESYVMPAMPRASPRASCAACTCSNHARRRRTSAATRQRRDPARGDRCGRAARERLERAQRGVERHELHGARARR